MSKLTILSDLDGIVAANLQKWLRLYNRDFSDNLSVGDLKEYGIEKFVKPDAKKRIYSDYIERDGWFDHLEPLPGAIGTLKSLAMDGHQVVFATSPVRNPRSAEAKIRWVQAHGFSPADVIIIHHKHLLRGDVFIDDSPDKLRAYRRSWPKAHVLTIAYPYNSSVASQTNLRAEGWDAPREAWKQIGEYIRHVAHG